MLSTGYRPVLNELLILESVTGITTSPQCAKPVRQTLGSAQIILFAYMLIQVQALPLQFLDK